MVPASVSGNRAHACLWPSVCSHSSSTLSSITIQLHLVSKLIPEPPNFLYFHIEFEKDQRVFGDFYNPVYEVLKNAFYVDWE